MHQSVVDITLKNQGGSQMRIDKKTKKETHYNEADEKKIKKDKKSTPEKK